MEWEEWWKGLHCVRRVQYAQRNVLVFGLGELEGYSSCTVAPETYKCCSFSTYSRVHVHYTCTGGDL